MEEEEDEEDEEDEDAEEEEDEGEEEDEEQEEEDEEEEEEGGEKKDLDELDMVAIWRGNEVHIAGRNHAGIEFKGQWFNCMVKKQNLSLRIYKPAWIDRQDNKEKFTYSKPSGMHAHKCSWKEAEQLVAHFTLEQHKIPGPVALAIEAARKKARPK